jgi:hypothetical protein
MKFRIKLINVGRNKICQKYKLEAKDLDICATLVLEQVKRFLVSEDVSLVPDENDEEKWTVFAGFQSVGKVRIEEIG